MRTHFSLFCFLAAGCLLTARLAAQGVGVNTDGSSPDGSALLDVKSTDKGLLVPRVSLSDVTSASPVTSPATGLLVYNTNASVTGGNGTGFYYWTGSQWVRLDASNSGDWRLTGNAGTSPATNFLGTTDAQALVFRTNNTERVRVLSGGNVGIGTTAPASLLHVAGVANSTVARFTVPSGWGQIIVTNGATTVDLGSSTSEVFMGANSNHPLLFRTNATERMRLNTNTTNNTELSMTGTASNMILYNTAGVNAPTTGTRSAGSKVVWYPQVSGTEVDYATGIEGSTLWHSVPGTASTYQHRFYAGTQRLIDVQSNNQTLLYGAGDNTFTAPANGFVTLNVEGSIFMPSGQSLWLGNTADAGDRFRFHHAAGNSYIDYATGFLQIRSGTTDRVRITAAGDVGIGTTAPAHRLQVAGNARVEGYLLVGNPAAPSSAPSSGMMGYYSTGDEGFAGWQNQDVCGGAGANWGMWYVGSSTENAYAQYDNIGSRTRKNFLSPWIWVPTGAAPPYIYLHFNNTLESGVSVGYDGVFLERSTNGTTWTKITAFALDGYNFNTNGSNTACSANDAQMAWSNNGWRLPASNDVPTGTWVRFRLVGFEDNTVNTGNFRLYRMILEGTGPSIGGAFAAGNIYAQNNVYAGSNVLLGDLAEYFTVSGASEPGNLVALDPVMPDRYVVAKGAGNPHVIGIHSEHPTLTLNNPNSGVPVALRGRVPVKVCTQNGPLRIGDLLTVSDEAGHAMKATGKCYVIGRALESFEGPGKGKILCLVEGAWYNPAESAAEISSGSAVIPKGRKEFTVYDSRFGTRSKAFITFTGEGGSPYWIAKDKPGQFTIRLAQPAETDVPIDYLIEYGEPAPASVQNDDNTWGSTGDEISYTRPEDFETGGWQYDPVKNVYWRQGKAELPPGVRVVPFPEDTQPLPPPLPPNPEWPCYYIPGEGYKYSRDVQRAMRLAAEAQKAQR